MHEEGGYIWTGCGCMLGDTDECERVEAHVAGGSTHPDAPVTIASSDEDIEVTGVCGHFLAVWGTCYSVCEQMAVFLCSWGTCLAHSEIATEGCLSSALVTYFTRQKTGKNCI
jgi:hypothetical protein